MRDNVSRLGTVVNALGLSAVKTTITGPSVDLAPYNAATWYLNCGTYTDGTHTFVIQESPDNSTWNNVAATDLVAWSATSTSNTYPLRLGNQQPNAITNAASAVNQRVGYIGGLRYVRVVDTVTGSPVTGCLYDSYWILGEPRNMPASV
jgi:hypothetical protein